MNHSYKILCEVLSSSSVPFVVHKHEPRRGSTHYDLRFQDPKDKNILYSFAMPSNFLETYLKKTPVVKTRVHGKHWLDLKSYRLDTIDQGSVTIKVATSKYFDLEFDGKILKGKYKLFKLKNTRRDDYWLLVFVSHQ